MTSSTSLEGFGPGASAVALRGSALRAEHLRVTGNSERSRDANTPESCLVIARSEATKQSSGAMRASFVDLHDETAALDCFASLAMTTTKRKKEAERRQTCVSTSAPYGRGAHPCLFPLSRSRGRVGRGHARLSAFHQGSHRQGFRPLGAAPGQASWDAAGRSILNGRSNRGAKTSRSDAGVTRARLSQSRERTSRTGRSAGQHDARNCPGAECIVPRAGTALAPPLGIPSRQASSMSEIRCTM